MRPFLLIIDGPLGGGKSTVSQILHRRLPRTVLLSLDDIRGQFSDYHTTNKEYKRLANGILQFSIYFLLKNKINVVLDQGFTHPESNQIIEKVFNDLKGRVDITAYCLNVTPEVAYTRIKHSRASHIRPPIRASLARVKRNHQRHLLHRYRNVEKELDTLTMSAEKVAGVILKDVLPKAKR